MKMNFNIIAAAAVAGISFMGISCTEEVVIGSLDESRYSNVNTVNGYVRDAKTGKADNVIELRTESYESSLVFGLSKMPAKA